MPGLPQGGPPQPEGSLPEPSTQASYAGDASGQAEVEVSTSFLSQLQWFTPLGLKELSLVPLLAGGGDVDVGPVPGQQLRLGHHIPCSLPGPMK